MRSFSFLLILLMGANLAIAQDSLTLEQALSMALDKNFGIQLSKKQNEVAANNVHVGNAGVLPKLDAQAGISYDLNNTNVEYNGPIEPVDEKGAATTTYNASVGLSYTLWDGLGMFRNYTRLKEIRNVQDAETRINIENTLVQVTALFFETVKASQNQELANENLSISRERLQRFRLREEYGNAGSIDLLNAQVDFNTDSATYLMAKSNLSNQRQNLKFLLGGNLEESAAISRKVVQQDFTFDGMLEAAMNTNISIQLAKSNLNVSKLDVKIVKGFRSPRLIGNASYGYYEQRADAGFVSKNKNTGFSGGLTVAMNLFDGYKTNINAQNARLALESTTIALEQAEAVVERDLAVALNNFEQANAIASLEKSTVSTAQANFERSKEFFNLGQISNTQFREAQVNLSRSKFRLIEARINLKLAETEILRVSGQLIQ